MIGQTISHYRIEEQLGQGGMGIVYRAVDTKLDRDVALKFLPPALSEDPDAKARFIQEAKAASSLDHPNICTIHEIGEAEDGRLFIAMAYYEGQTLKYRLEDGAMAIDDAASITYQILEGLERSHEAGIIHRDLKPANIMVTNRGRVKILDFGVAKLGAGADLTKAGSTVGTTAYMSPEQARGDVLDTRADLWSVGVLLYEMLSGRKPFGGEYEQAVLYAVLNEIPEALDDSVPEEVRGICEKLLIKDVDGRYGSAAEVLTDLSPYAGTRTRTVAEAPVSAAPASNLFSSRTIIGAAGTVVVVFLAWLFLKPSATTPVSQAPTVREGIAVLPFTVRGDTTLNYMSQAIVSLLSTKIDGVGDLRSIDDHALLGYIRRSGNPIMDPEMGAEIANHFGAAGFILGDIQRVGGPIQISASRYTAGGELEEEFEVSVRADSLLLNAVDDLARNLISEHLADAGSQLESMAAVASASFPALREHLRGEVYFRRGLWEEAYASFKRATDIDSTFSLAWFRLANSAGWGSNPRGEVLPSLQAALRHGETLPARMRQKIEGDIAFELAKADLAERHFRELARDYPDDAYAWYRLAETRYHYGYIRGRSPQEALGPFLKAWELDPEQSEIAFHLFELDMEQENFERLEALSDALGFDDDAILSSLRLLLPVLATDSLALRNETIAQLADSSETILAQAAFQVAHFLEDFVLADTLVSIAIDRATRSETEGLLRMRSRYRLAAGRWKDAWEDKMQADVLGGGDSYFDQLYAYNQNTPIPEGEHDRVRSEIRALSDTIGWPGPFVGLVKPVMKYYEAVVAVGQRDDAFVDDVITYLDGRAGKTPNDTTSVSLARRLEARMAFRDGEYEKALERLDESRLNPPFRWSGSLLNQSPENMIRAEALYALGRYDEALRWLEALGDGLGNTMVGFLFLNHEIAPSYLMQAKIHENKGNHERAIHFYTRFIETWENADPEFQPAVAEARESLDRLVLNQTREPG